MTNRNEVKKAQGKIVTVKQIQRMDRVAIDTLGIPSVVLMENAGKAVAREALAMVKGKKSPRVCVVCGLGNNAGDGFVAARHLLEAGIRTAVYLLGRASQLKNDAAVNYGILRKLKYPVYACDSVNAAFLKDIQTADMVVDAIFGVGLNRKVEEPFKGAIDALNARGKKILAVDIPSGLDGTTGKIYGACVMADVTVTFSALKRGFFKGQGPAHVGKMIVADIGIPKKLLKAFIASS